MILGYVKCASMILFIHHSSNTTSSKSLKLYVCLVRNSKSCLIFFSDIIPSKLLKLCFCCCFFKMIRVGERIQITLKHRHTRQNAIKMTFHWRGDDSHILNAGFVRGSSVIFQGVHTSNAKKPYMFVIFQELGPDPLSPAPPHPSGSTYVLTFSRLSVFMIYDFPSNVSKPFQYVYFNFLWPGQINFH